ncbi:MAG: hypothetical protein ACI8RD_008978 [Bacillariaceae sp.]
MVLVGIIQDRRDVESKPFLWLIGRKRCSLISFVGGNPVEGEYLERQNSKRHKRCIREGKYESNKQVTAKVLIQYPLSLLYYLMCQSVLLLEL